MIKLKIGMATADGSIRILDEDRLCYQVLSHSRGATGVRTISKKLLREWVAAVDEHPDMGAGDLRDLLCGKTEIDKFEYGYFGSLKKMAEMILGRLEVENHGDDHSAEFIAWFAEYRGKGKTNTGEKYIGYFKTLTNTYKDPTNSYWHGLYRIVYGKDAEQEVVAIGTVGEFDRIYGGLIVALEKKIQGEGMTDEGFAKAIEWFWKPEVKSHTCVTSALNAYRDFLEWREQQVKEAPSEELTGVDRLTIALKLFREARKTSVSSDVRYWIFSPGEQACRWDEMRDGGVMALSYEECGRDLREYADEEAIRAEFKSSEEDDASYKNHVRALTDFLNVMKPGDIVFAKKGTKTFLGVGRVTGEYEFAADAPDYKHRRAVEWLKAETVERDDAVARKTLTDVTRYDDLVRELCEAYGIEEGVATNANATDWGCQDVRDWFDAFTPEKLKEDFNYFRSRMLWSKRVRGSIGREYKHIDELGAVMQELKDSPRPIGYYASDEFVKKCPDGFGKSTATDFLMKFHPDGYISFTGNMMDALDFLGLWPKDVKRDMEVCYNELIGAATRVRNRMNDFDIGRFPEGKKPEADYLTVNEFLWWVKTHQDLIKEEIMSQKMKKPSIAIKAGAKTLSGLIGKDPDSMMSRLTAALLTKPFAILAGASGTGKSRMVRQLAYMTCLNTDLQEEAKDATAPGNYRLVQVKPNWHDSSDLLGYRSAINEGTYVTTDFVKFVLKAHAYPDTPFFVCLDEMNLAPVEQYFAEFLSASEDVKKADDGKTLVSAALIKPSDFGGDVLNLEPEYELSADCKALIEKIGLFIPHNLYVVGTVNMDDTTCQFSRKVLDRAMTIEMNEVKLETLQKKDVMTFDDLLLTEPEIKLFAERAEFDGEKFDNPFRDKLDSLRGDLESSPFAIAYRFAREAVMYREAIAKIGNDTAKAAKDEIALDHMSLMKILPRITGTTTERKGVTDKLTAFFSGLGRPLSLKKLNEMIAAASGNGEYLSFWP